MARHFRHILCFLVISWIILALLPHYAETAWYDFAKQRGVPEISELRIGKMELETLPDLLSLNEDDIEGGVLIIRGQTEISEGKIGAVLISLDGGANWQRSNLTSGGFFNFEFRPEVGREYQFVIKAIATTGKSSDPEDGTFPMIIKRDRSEEKCKEAFFTLLRHYMNENYDGFMSLVSEDFEGDLNALEDAIEEDFRSLDNININAVIVRTTSQKDRYEIFFTFNRKVLSARSGQQLKDSASSNVTLKRTDRGFQLTSMAAPLIFGLSDLSEVATSVEESSVGQEVIVVTESGEAQKTTQKENVEETEEWDESDIRTGSATLNGSIPPEEGSGTIECFTVETQTVANDTDRNVFHGDFNGNFAPIQDLIPDGPVNFSTSDAQIQEIGTGSLSSYETAPETGYSESSLEGEGVLTVTNGHVYAIKTSEPLYALIKITAVSNQASPFNFDTDTVTYLISFEYKVQMNGTRNFE